MIRTYSTTSGYGAINSNTYRGFSTLPTGKQTAPSKGNQKRNLEPRNAEDTRGTNDRKTLVGAWNCDSCLSAHFAHVLPSNFLVSHRKNTLKPSEKRVDWSHVLSHISLVKVMACGEIDNVHYYSAQEPNLPIAHRPSPNPRDPAGSTQWKWRNRWCLLSRLTMICCNPRTPRPRHVDYPLL